MSETGVSDSLEPVVAQTDQMSIDANNQSNLPSNEECDQTVNTNLVTNDAVTTDDVDVDVAVTTKDTADSVSEETLAGETLNATSDTVEGKSSKAVHEANTMQSSVTNDETMVVDPSPQSIPEPPAIPDLQRSPKTSAVREVVANDGIASPMTPSIVELEKPSDIRFLTIKNLDTGEEFVIGENDPDFEFDTFEIGAHPNETQATETAAADTDPAVELPQPHEIKAQRRSWWRSFFHFVYGNNSKVNLEVKIDSANTQDDLNAQQTQTNSQKTPFTKLSSFKFRRELGRGAFGRVLLAEAKTDGKLYALKIISKKNMRSSDKRQAKAERDILHAMTLKAPHPFTSGLKFAFQSENNLYLGMDFIPGGNLRELIKKFKYLPEDWVQFYAAELILAISHLHSMNVLYRDIKPHNVMIDARGHLILIDFGLSKQEISHPRGALSLVGTPDYSAPEVLRTGVQQIEQHNREKALRAQNLNGNLNGKLNKKKKTASTNGKKASDTTYSTTENKHPHIGYGKAADWWSLGIMIYEMIGGKPTFRGADLRETYQRILYSKLEFIPEDRFSPAAKSLLEGLINRDPSMRLGAWENPPKDIMSSPFFANIQWDAIYERRQDGPFLPELQSFIKKRLDFDNHSSGVTSMQSTGSSPRNPTSEEAHEEPSAWKKMEFTPIPLERLTVSDPAKEEEERIRKEKEREKEKLREREKQRIRLEKEQEKVRRKQARKEERRLAKIKEEEELAGQAEDGVNPASVDSNNSGVGHVSDAENDSSDESDDTDVSEEEEEVHEDDDEMELAVRDSIFVRGGGDTVLPDWSFIDEAVLMSYVTNASLAEKQAQRAQEKQARKQKRLDCKQRAEKENGSEQSPIVEPMATIEEEKEDETQSPNTH